MADNESAEQRRLGVDGGEALGAPRRGVGTWFTTGWRKWVGEHALAPIITGIIVALALLIWGPIVAENLALQNPTCEDPEGAIPLPRDQLVAVDEGGEVNDDKIDASKTHEPDPNSPDEQHVDWDPGNVIDGESLTFWVPEGPHPGAKPPYITLPFDQSVDLALVCIVNGFQYSAISAPTANRLRTVRVSTNEPNDPEVTYLQAVGGAELQNPQTLRIDKGHTTEITLSIIDVYPGQEVLDPVAAADPATTAEPATASDPATKLLLRPTGHTTIGEIYLFRKDPDVKPVWRAWWPVDWPFD
jgi:hypothetical protein